MDSQNMNKKEDIVAYSSYERKRQRIIILRRVLVIVISVLLVGLMTFLILDRYFRIDTIIIDGSDKYSYTQLCKTAQIENGQSLFSVKEKKIKERLMSAYPYIKDVEVDKEYPSEISITVYEEIPSFYVEIENEYFIITAELKVLERYVDLQRLLSDYPDIVCVRTTAVYQAIAPRRIIFKQENDQRYISKVLVGLSEWEEYGKIKSIDISNKFDITVDYDGRISLELGNRYDLDTKLIIVSTIIKDHSANAYGSINVKNVEEAIARITEP